MAGGGIAMPCMHRPALRMACWVGRPAYDAHDTDGDPSTRTLRPNVSVDVAYAVLLLAGADGRTGGTTSVTPRRLARCIGRCVATGDVTDPHTGAWGAQPIPTPLCDKCTVC
jgi:hypothetical protein